MDNLRLLPTFAGALREKNRTRASFNKIPTNYISVECLINVLAMFSFSMYQEAVRRETTEGSSIEFIGLKAENVPLKKETSTNRRTNQEPLSLSARFFFFGLTKWSFFFLLWAGCFIFFTQELLSVLIFP